MSRDGRRRTPWHRATVTAARATVQQRHPSCARAFHRVNRHGRCYSDSGPPARLYRGLMCSLAVPECRFGSSARSSGASDQNRFARLVRPISHISSARLPLRVAVEHPAPARTVGPRRNVDPARRQAAR